MEKFYRTMRIVGTLAVVYMGAYYSLTQPGYRDFINGTLTGLAVYAIWFARERAK